MKKAGFYIEDAVQVSTYDRACKVAGQRPATDSINQDSKRSLHALTLGQLSKGIVYLYGGDK